MLMTIGIGLGNPAAWLARRLPVQAVNADGWSVRYTAPPPAFDPVNAPETLNLKRPGFDAGGQPVLRNETLTLMARVRRPYPDQATLDPDRVSLSDFVDADDIVEGVANNSTLAPPLPVACWMTPDLTHARGPVFTARLAVAHAHARAGRPVAAVRFIASDGVATVEHWASTMSTAAFGSGLQAPFFEAAIDLSLLADGALCTLDAEIYPWVGRPFRIALDGDAYPSSNLTVLKFLNDRSGAFGTAYAYVDAVAGSDVAGVVSVQSATAAATPFATVAAAATAIQAHNAANFGRNDTAGGIIRLNAGSHAHANFSAAASGMVPLVIEAADPTARATTVYTDAGASVSAGCPAKILFRDLTLRKTGASVIFLDNGATLATLERMMVLERVSVDRNATSGYAAWIYRVGRLFLNEVDGDADGLFAMFNGNACKQINAVGCSGPWGSDVIFNAVACRLHGMKRVNGFANIEQGRGQLFSHCHLTAKVDGRQTFDIAGAPVGARGLAVVGSVMEQAGGATGAAVRIAADNDLHPVQNVLFQANTVVGSRTNWLYQDSGSTTIAKRGAMRFTINRLRNTKTDVFGQNAALVGNWPAAYNVGARANVAIEGDNLGPGTSVPGPGEWIGEVAALGDLYGSAAAPVVCDFARDASATGTMAGGGDYTPGPANVLPAIPPGMAPYPIDMLGRAIRDDGFGLVGALQPV